MKISIRRGFSFGLASGITTALGLMIGLYASTESKMVVIGGIIAMAIADANKNRQRHFGAFKLKKGKK